MGPRLLTQPSSLAPRLMPSLLPGKPLTPMLLMMLVSQLIPALLLLMLLLAMFGMPELQPTLGQLIPGPPVLMDIHMVMLLTMDTLLQLTAILMPTTDGEKNKQSE